MTFRRFVAGAAIAAAAALALGISPVSAKTLRMANQGDPMSMDPHALNETLQLTFTSNVYEALVGYGKDQKLVPLLATDWKQTAPTVWRFNLRKGVTFHDGTPFTAADVIFSYNRAKAEGSDIKTYVGSIKEVKKVNDHAVDFVTDAPNPILPNVFVRWMIMSQKWCTENRAENPVDKRKGIENAASFKANGTGPYRVKSRDPGNRTVLVRNANYWDKTIPTNIDEIVFTPISNAATRVAALISGEIDMMEPVPVQDVARINASPNAKVLQGPELRTIFLGMDQKRDELLFSNVKGKNPFKDKRVRQAFYQAIDIEAIKTSVMRGAAVPAGLMEAPGTAGFPADLNKRLPFDPEGAKKLLAAAGYPNGFEVGMNCPNDRYVNDAAICQAVAAMLAKVGVKVNLTAETKVSYFPKILSRNTSFYLLGWTPATVDSHDPLYALMATPGAGGQGQFNLGAYSNPKLDELTTKIQSETDQPKRNAMIHEAMKIHQDDIGHIPLHQQALAWGVRKNLDLVQLPSNDMFVKWWVLK